MSDNINRLEKEPTVDGYVTEKLDVLYNGLLGEYNQNGKYIISPQIITELVKVRKYRRNSFNNAVYCVAQSKVIGDILFEIIFKKNSKDEGAATLNVLEHIKKVNGYILNTIKTPISVYKAPISPRFIDHACEAFSLIQDAGEGMEYTADKIDEQIYILAKHELSNMLGKLSFEEYNMIYEGFFKKRMEILKDMNNPFSKQILDTFDLEYDKIKNFFLSKKSPLQYKALNELLDKVIEDVSGLTPENRQAEEDYRVQITPVLKGFMLQAGTLETKCIKEVEKEFPRGKKEVLKEVLGSSIEIREDKSDKKQPPKVLDKSPNIQKTEQKQQVEKVISSVTSAREGMAALKEAVRNKKAPNKAPTARKAQGAARKAGDPMRTGLKVNSSEEFRDRELNEEARIKNLGDDIIKPSSSTPSLGR